MFYRNFPSIPLILVITRQNRKTLFCIFLSFRNLPRLKLTQDFRSINILSREPAGYQEVNEMRPRVQTSPSGALPGYATHARLSLGPPMPSIFVSWCSAWPKKRLYIDPLNDPETRRWRNTKHKKQRLFRCQNHYHRHEEGVVHLWTIGLWK
jgi:hypothetical protein